MFKRAISAKISEYRHKYRAIALIGPRQSGKTTLARHEFPDHQYLSLENPDTRSRAIEDPRNFLGSIKGDSILDEVQYVPDLLSYLQEHLDDKSDKRQFILTGSNSFKLNQKISQSLAGRVRLLKILPFFRTELPPQERPEDLNKSLLFGGYPRIYDEKLNPSDWFADYFNTYIQKDVRAILEVDNLVQFDRFVRLSAGRAGQLTNFSSLASDVGLKQPTAARWMSVLEASFIVFRLEPHFKNFNKRITKSPKIYFYDTGLLCYLLKIRNSEQLDLHPLRGAIFENWVVSELTKAYFSKAEEPPLFFWRDQHGHEVDIILDLSTRLHPVEVKSGTTFKSEWLGQLEWFNKLQDYRHSSLIYGGEENFSHSETKICSWQNFPDTFSVTN